MTNRRKIYKDFQKEFPIESLAEMPIEKYTNLKKNSFCYWLETKTKDLGSISGGTSHKFCIYEYNNRPNNIDHIIDSDDKYAWYSKYNKATAYEAFELVRASLVRIAKAARKHNYSEIDSIKELGDSYKWKIAFLYSNEDLIPIYKKEMLIKVAMHFGMKDANNATRVELQSFLIKQKGNKDIFDFYEDLLKILKANNNNKYWIYSPGEKAFKWDWCQKRGIMCLGWPNMGDLEQYQSKNDITLRLKEIYKKDSSFKNDSLALWEFVHEMKAGDIVYAKKGANLIVGRGVIKDDYYFDDTLERFKHFRRVDWTNIGEWPAIGKNITKTLTDITKYPDYVNKLENIFGINSNNINNNSKQYWWLVASPKIWQFSNIGLDEEEYYTLYNENGSKRRIFQNYLNAKVGDIVIGYEAHPKKQIVALAEVSKENDGKKIYFKKKESLPYPINYSDIKNLPELDNMQFLKNKNGTFFKLTEDEYNTIIDIIRKKNPKSQEQSYESYNKSDFLNDVFMEEEDYSKLRSILLNKQNIILQGAPGVGKTFTAKRLAYSIIEKKDISKIEIIQFHQNYSYEDFVMGYRPNDEGGFDLRKGVFYNFCKKAQNDPDNKYFFIIDEINRGNMSKIFGELLMLIEKDYRGKENEITLAYNNERFFVPKNIFIIGMMNTADRSLAMIDYALRRRFSFYEMQPRFSSKGFKKYLEKVNNADFTRLINRIIELNNKIKEDESLGGGFCIGHSYFCNENNSEDIIVRLNNIVEFDICPMLREYWFDNNQKYETEKSALMQILSK